MFQTYVVEEYVGFILWPYFIHRI